jgi:hypothetical protein
LRVVPDGTGIGQYPGYRVDFILEGDVIKPLD